MNYVFVLASWNRNCGRVAFIDRARCRGMGRASRLVESARLPACVHGINDSGRDIFRARDRRVNRRQTADDVRNVLRLHR